MKHFMQPRNGGVLREHSSDISPANPHSMKPTRSGNRKHKPSKQKIGADFGSENGGPGSADSGVKVIVRMRPLNNNDEGGTVIQETSGDSLTMLGHRFTFDHVADLSSTQIDIFQLVGAPFVENCLAGFNSSIFAYGQTGSGKTYTIWGPANTLLEEASNSNEQGLTSRVFSRLFSRTNEEENIHADKQLTYQCRCSFLEIYNEQIIDLLNPSQRNLHLREDNKTGVYVENLTEETICSMKDVTQLLKKGLSNRNTGSTSLNSESSRSHSVFTCVVESSCKSVDGLRCFKTSRMNLVDLAGSERQKSTGAAGERLKEAGNINRSLSQLGNLINILAEVSQSGKPRHIPYRDSKLTFLLQESLGGNAKLAMICTISPAESCKNETLSTLRFAQRAKAIKNKAIVNEKLQNDVNTLRQPEPESTNQRFETESKWVALVQDLEHKLQESQHLVEKQKHELETERKCAKESKDAMQMAMEGHAKMLEQYADLEHKLQESQHVVEKQKHELETERKCAKDAMQMAMEGHVEQYADLEEKHINLLTKLRRIEDRIIDVKKTGAESKFINALAEEISVLKAENEKYYRDESNGLEAQIVKPIRQPLQLLSNLKKIADLGIKHVDLMKDSIFHSLSSVTKGRESSAALIMALCKRYDQNRKGFQLNEKVFFSFCTKEVADIIGMEDRGISFEEYKTQNKFSASFPSFVKGSNTKKSTITAKEMKGVLSAMKVENDEAKENFRRLMTLYLIEEVLLCNRNNKVQGSLWWMVSNLDACEGVNWAKATEDHLHRSMKEAQTWLEKGDFHSGQHMFIGAAPVLEAILYERIPEMRPSEWADVGSPIQKWKPHRRDDKWVEDKFIKLTSTSILPCKHCSASSGSPIFPSREAVNIIEEDVEETIPMKTGSDPEKDAVTGSQNEKSSQEYVFKVEDYYSNPEVRVAKILYEISNRLAAGDDLQGLEFKTFVEEIESQMTLPTCSTRKRKQILAEDSETAPLKSQQKQNVKLDPQGVSKKQIVAEDDVSYKRREKR